MKTIALFGATGKTGSEVLKILIQKGFKVRVLVRDPKKLVVNPSPNLLFLKGDILSQDDVEKVVDGSEVIINCIGHDFFSSPRGLQTRAIQNIIAAMQKMGLKRIIDLTSTAVSAPGDKQLIFNSILRFSMELFLNKIFSDAVTHAQLIAETNLDWTIVRANVLSSNVPTGNYKIGLVGDKNMRFQVPRGDVAKFIVDIIDDSNYFRSFPLVG